MSGDKSTSPCNKFQANIFNKSKCQNCFKSRELHLLNDSDLEKAKPIYGGWLCLAPEGTDFENPMQRSRKWQRRFFILYEHGSLTFALDELPSTLPQGTVNLNQCSEVVDAEPRTGQRNALCVATPEQEIFIRGDSREIINGWNEQLVVFPRTNKQNQKKKRKVEPVTTQEPSPAKMAATDPCFTSSPSSSSVCGRWQEAAVAPPWAPERTPAGSPSSYLCPDAREALPLDGAGGFVSPVDSLDLVANGNGNAEPISDKQQLARSNDIPTSAENQKQTGRDKSRLGPGATEDQQTDGPRTGRSASREKLQSCGEMATLSASPPQRRSKSLDRRTSDTVMTPDLLNFKKGWMVKLEESDQWKKYWFVLSTDSLRYYKDSVAEEASDLEGEMDLTKCYNVSEYQVQRNYGFQIHTPTAVYTLSAMTAGIRKNWIQALMKNVHPANAPDVASLPGHHVPCAPPEALPKPDVTQDSPSADPSPAKELKNPKRRSVTERRREGRYKTFDWAEFRPQTKTDLDSDTHNNNNNNKDVCSLEVGDLERRKRRVERRKRYENMLGFSLDGEKGGRSQQRVEEQIEECWRMVEKSAFGLETRAPLATQHRDPGETERLLDGYRSRVEDLKAQLEEAELHRINLEAQLSSAGLYGRQLDPPPSSEADPCSLYPDEKPSHCHTHTQTMAELFRETKELLQKHNRADSESKPPKIWLHDADGQFQELADLLPETLIIPLSTTEPESQHLVTKGDGENLELHLDLTTTTKNQQNELNRGDYQNVGGSETQIAHCDYTPLVREEPSEQAEAVKRLSQEMELLSGQNEALNQRNQEMVNQLTEADREIERLKAELSSSSRYPEPHHHPDVEQTRSDSVETELSLSNQRLLEAQSLISSLEENLRETESILLMNGQEKNDSTAEKDHGYLLQCLEAVETKLTELEKQLEQSQTTCSELRTQSDELKESEKLYRQTAAENEADIMRLNRELEEEKSKSECQVEEKGLQHVIEGMGTRLKALGKLLEAIDQLDVSLGKESEDSKPTVEGRLKWEEEFWGRLLGKLESSQCEGHEDEPLLLREITERMMAEKQMLLLAHDNWRLGEGTECLKEPDVVWNAASETDAKETDESMTFDFDNEPCEIKDFRLIAERQMCLLNRLSTCDHDKLQLMEDKLSNVSGHPMSGFIHSAATEALYCCRISRLRSKQEKELEETRQKLLTSSLLVCGNCVDLMEENKELRRKLLKLEEEKSQSPAERMDVWCQADEVHAQDAATQCESIAEEEVQTLETEQEDAVEEKSEEGDLFCKETEQVLMLRKRVLELEERLSVIAEEMREEHDGKMSSARTHHEQEMEKLKLTCSHGLTSMEESHVKVIEDLQNRYQQEVQRLLVERDRLLDEESAATATAIAAIKNAHQMELEREVQKRCLSENNTGNTQLDVIYRQHSAELWCQQRELQALSQQLSVRCLESSHLSQALDAERSALGVCQQENQELRTRNQELSGHLAAEITRLCSLAKQDHLPLSQGMDLYEMEITLRVKESEVQCLKQELSSLKEELQSAQKDKRKATKRYKEVSTELTIHRAKSERDVQELRENLRLLHGALDQTSP